MGTYNSKSIPKNDLKKPENTDKSKFYEKILKCIHNRKLSNIIFIDVNISTECNGFISITIYSQILHNLSFEKLTFQNNIQYTDNILHQ